MNKETILFVASNYQRADIWEIHPLSTKKSNESRYISEIDIYDDTVEFLITESWAMGNSDSNRHEIPIEYLYDDNWQADAKNKYAEYRRQLQLKTDDYHREEAKQQKEEDLANWKD